MFDTAETDSAPGDTGGGETGEPAHTGDTGGGEETGEAALAEACYLGPGRDHAVCIPVVPYDEGWGEDYHYPDPYDGSAQYLPPARFVDLETTDPGLELAPNFALDEYMVAWKGRWGVMQPHAVEGVQAVRDDVGGPVSVNSGYRSPAYNEAVGGVTYSRHQYGDAADLDVDDMSADALADICEAHGADYVATYETGHTHCDWRDAPLDPAFYDAGEARAMVRRERPRHVASLHQEGGRWEAPAEGFDEGEPLRLWTAYDARGEVVSVGEGRRFQPPADARQLQVRIGHQITLEVVLDAR